MPTQKQGRSYHQKITDTDACKPQSLPADSHLISGPVDITVYLPVRPACNKVSTCLPAGLPLPLCIFGYFQGVGVLSWKCETVHSTLEDMAKFALFDQVYTEVHV